MDSLFDNSRLVSLNFRQFCPLYGTTVTIPANVLLYTKNTILVDSRPKYFTSKFNSKDISYNTYISNRPLSLIDIRYMKDLMINIFTSSNYESCDLDMVIFICSLALGLCSYKKPQLLTSTYYQCILTL